MVLSVQVVGLPSACPTEVFPTTFHVGQRYSPGIWPPLPVEEITFQQDWCTVTFVRATNKIVFQTFCNCSTFDGRILHC
jgi:hypothetical protein